MVFAGFCLFVVASVLLTGLTAHSDGLSAEDEAFCRGGLELSYPDLDIKACMVIPQEVREKISKDWGPPKVQLATAEKGSGLRAGDIKGTVLSAYSRPTPPIQTGFHRYQFLLYEQPTDQVLSLSEQEKSSLGNWDPQMFVQKFGLEGPVTSLQFLTQNHRD
ncbi:phosphatidylethanolamine-binding protein 4 isoform X5 [Pygocentrus nattereri]|uniref:phosphatidylethanolamine-binding protein 4 isoform X5 n=1 Tax=Pygocentrus nattereri TaxID=42514 RepID=UPI0018914770|nr:phosphatidylethanolamine-binding protein 4 isoform X5 [Pygocentrus nattereri]